MGLKDHYICIQYRRLKFRLKIFIEGSFYLLLGKLFYRQHKEVRLPRFAGHSVKR
jgi:hypothetical protein